MSATELTDFTLSVRQLEKRNAIDGELGSTLIAAAIQEALLEYSLARPRLSRRATVSIAIDDESIALPSDFLMDHADNEPTLFLLTYGYQQPTFRVPGAYPPQRSGNLSSFDSALGATTDPPSSGALYSVPSSIPKSTDDEGNPVLTLSDAATEARSYDIVYSALHIIRDASGEITGANTVPREDRALLRRLCMLHLAEARERDWADKKNAELSKLWGEIAEKYQDAREKLTAAVGFGIW